MTLARRLAAAQTVPIAGDVEANIAQHVELARAAGREQARVLVFPELSLTGYELELAPSLAFSSDDARLTPLIEVARAASVCLIAGAPVRLATGLHIAAFIIAADGSLSIHTKRQLGAFSREDGDGRPLPPAESTIFTPGASAPLLALETHSAVLAICAESLQRWVMREAAQRGAQAYLTSHFSLPRDRAARLDGFARFAAHYRIPVVFANYGGVTAGLEASGGSAILSPAGERLCELPARGAGLSLAHEHEDGWRARTLLL
jgi:predicted amidohydrolase